MFRLLLSLLCGLLLLAAPASPAPLIGSLEGDIYVSPTGQFRIRAPVLPELGGTIIDTPNVVTFQDNFGTHISVACFEFDATQRWEYDTRGRRDYLLYFFTDIVMANFQQRFPGSKVESARYLPTLREGALIGYALLPGGSEFEHTTRMLNDPPADPVTAKRGTLLFVHNRYVYAISTELAERATQRSTYRLTREQEDEQLSARLTGVLERMTFTSERSLTP